MLHEGLLTFFPKLANVKLNDGNFSLLLVINQKHPSNIIKQNCYKTKRRRNKTMFTKNQNVALKIPTKN